jgi:rare lipoprotein A (peptidoglycan hydrolase)
MFLLTILDRDQAALQLATKLSAEASYEEGVLRGLRTQDAALREVQASRLKTLRAALGQQRSLATSLSVQQRAYVDGRARFDAGERNRWKAGSYRGAPPRRVPAAVEPYTDRRYLVDDAEPLAYTTTGRISTELCSWYGNAGNGTATASGRAYNENEFTCATVLRDPEDPSGVRMLPFGTRLALTRGDRRIIVAVTDRGPYASKRTIDLSRSAAEALGFDGLAEVNVEIVTAK